MDKTCNVVVDLVSVTAILLALALMIGAFEKQGMAAGLESALVFNNSEHRAQASVLPCHRDLAGDVAGCAFQSDASADSALLGRSPHWESSP
ncbi:MAG: hypothetical protein PVI28_14465 [Gammaproteobacteria bacterium]|jgi:hypothetical protein